MTFLYEIHKLLIFQTTVFFPHHSGITFPPLFVSSGEKAPKVGQAVMETLNRCGF